MNYNKSMFSFRFQSYGRYLVTFQEKLGGDYYQASITDMTEIDAVKNDEDPTQDNLCQLALSVVYAGTHYDSNNNQIE